MDHRAHVNDYQTWPSETQYDYDTDVVDQHNSNGIYDRMARPGMTSAGPLCRFLDESERLLFTSPADHVDHPTPFSLSYSPVTRISGNVDLQSQTDRRQSSPSSSGLGSSLTSGARSECRDSPWASPQLAVVYPPLYGQDESVAFTDGGYPSYEEQGTCSTGGCVALHDVQRCADEQSALPAFEDTHTSYPSYGSVAQEGYHPMSTTDDDASETSHSAPCSEYCPIEEPPRRSTQVPDFRRRRTHSSNSMSSSTAGIKKRPPMDRRSSSYRRGSKSGTTDQGSVTTAGNRAFPCPFTIYGCTSVFASKNEWKRHVSTQHMRLGFWRCDQCAGDRKHNDFNRKDLFIQHVRRMHNTDSSGASSSKRSQSRSDKESEDEQAIVMAETAQRCYHSLRSPPEHSGCLFCEQEFHGAGTWDERMEHVGRHMESHKKGTSPTTDQNDWKFDEMVHEWMVQERLITARGTQWLLVQ